MKKLLILLLLFSVGPALFGQNSLSQREVIKIFDEMRDRIESLNDRIEQLNNQIKKKDQQLARASANEERYLILAGDVEGYLKQLDDYLRQNEELGITLQALRLDNTSLQEQQEDLNSQLHDNKQQAEEAHKRAEMTIARLGEELDDTQRQLLRVKTQLNQMEGSIARLSRSRFQFKYTTAMGIVNNSAGESTGRLLVGGDALNPVVRFNGESIAAIEVPFAPAPYDETFVSQARIFELIDQDERYRMQSLFGGNDRRFYLHHFFSVRYYFNNWLSVDALVGGGKYWHSSVVTLENPRNTYEYLELGTDGGKFAVNYGLGASIDILRCVLPELPYGATFSVNMGYPYKIKTGFEFSVPLIDKKLFLVTEANYFRWVDHDVYLLNRAGREVNVSEQTQTDNTKIQPWVIQNRWYFGLGLAYENWRRRK